MNASEATTVVNNDDSPDDIDLDAAMDALADLNAEVHRSEAASAAAAQHEVPVISPARAMAAPRRQHRGGLSNADATEGALVPSFVNGDSVELSEQLERDLKGIPAVDLTFAEGSFWRYHPATGAFVPITKEEPRRIVSGYSRLPIGTGRSSRPLAVSQRLVKDAVAACTDRLMDEHYFERATPGIAFRNGFLDASTSDLELRPHSPNHRARHALPFDYDPVAPCPRWQKFLTEIFPPVEVEDGPSIDDGVERAKLLQEFLGASLLGQATRYATTVVAVGEGSNGKSVLQKVVTAPFPQDAVSSIAPQRWSKSNYLADLAGKLLNVVSEVPARDIADTDLFKAVVTGDPVTADRKYEATFRFAPRAGHLFACNALPATRDHSEGFWRRFAVVHFNATFAGREDVMLAERLIGEELPGIVAWMIEGARQVFARGRYVLPRSSVQAKEEWQGAADQVQEFIAECVIPQASDERDTRPGMPPANGIPARDLYEIYHFWAIRSGHKALSMTVFGTRVKKFLQHKHAERRGLYFGRLTPQGERFQHPSEVPGRTAAPIEGGNNNIP